MVDVYTAGDEWMPGARRHEGRRRKGDHVRRGMRAAVALALGACASGITSRGSGHRARGDGDQGVTTMDTTTKAAGKAIGGGALTHVYAGSRLLGTVADLRSFSAPFVARVFVHGAMVETWHASKDAAVSAVAGR